MSRRAYPQYPPTAQNFPPAPQKQAYPGQPQPHSQGQGYYGAPPNPSDGVLSGPGAPHTGAMVSQMQHMSLRQPDSSVGLQTPPTSIPTATPLTGTQPQSQHNIVPPGSTSSNTSAQGPVTQHSNFRVSTPGTNIGPPPRPGEQYRAPAPAPPPAVGAYYSTQPGVQHTRPSPTPGTSSVGGIAGPPVNTYTTPTSTGPPTGHPTGPSMGGPPTGPSTGPPMGGPPTGPLTGPPMGGPPTGPLTGPPMGGPPTGPPMGGPPTGPSMGGPPTGHPTGPPTGPLTGPPTGPLPGPPTGTLTGPPIGGPPTGPPMGGHPTGHPTGPPTGPLTGPPTGPLPGPPTGPPTGLTGLTGTAVSSAQPMSGVTASGRVAHPLSGQPGAARTGQPGTGQMSVGPGQLSGMGKSEATGLTTAPAMAQTPGQSEGMSTSDPYMQPVNLLETRNILPPSEVRPPPIVLPNGMSKYAPDHRVFCCTMNAIPATSSLLSKTKLPLAIHLHPYKDMATKDCPVVHPTIIVRCRSCRAYINPYVTFIDSRHWRCNLCFRANTLPEDFDYNPHTGQHGDRSHRVELRRSSMEYIAPSEYMVRPPQPCVYYFVVDVSFTAIETGLVGVFCRSLLDQLDRLPGDARTLVGLLTFDSALHFYNFPSSACPPQMMVVSDIDDVFLPCPESLLVNLREFKEIFRSLLEDLPRMFASNQSDKSALGAALQAATKLLHPIGGRITVIQCTMPNTGPGALKYRDVSPSSTKMPSLNMAPASDFYKSLALDCNSQQIVIDLFAFSGQFMDLSTMSCAAKFSSGQIFHYHDFHHSRKVARERFEKDFKRYLTRRIGFEAVMRIRCTEGMSLHTFHGNFFVRSTDLLSLPCVNPDLGYTINISIDDNLKDFGCVCFQAALLYTSSRGERRIRVHTLCLPVATQLSHIYARLNILAITGTLANMGVDRACTASLGDAREALMNTAIDSAKMYRANVASSRQASQYTLPSSIRLLPLFIIALLKSMAFSLNSKITYDRRTQVMNQIKCTPLDYYMCQLYPRLYAVHMLTENDIVETDGAKEEIRPPILQLSAEKLNRYGVYLMDYGLGLYLWVCKDASQEYISKILGVPHFGAIPEIMCELPVLKNECSILLCKLLKQIRLSRQHFLSFQVIREDGPHRLLFIDRLVDDRTEMGTSYYELLTHIARQQGK